jgi:hypothetical protein
MNTGQYYGAATALQGVHAQARELDLTRTLTRADSVSFEIGRHLDAAHALLDALTGTRILERSYRELDSSAVRALARVNDAIRARDLDASLEAVDALVSALEAALETIHARIRYLDAVGARGRDLMRYLENALDHAADLPTVLARNFVRQYAQDDLEPQAEPEAGRITRPAARLVAVATRMLPAANRDRYFEEYQSELWEIANGGGGGSRREQLLYAGRQFLRVLSLRGAVLTPRRRKASP